MTYRQPSLGDIRCMEVDIHGTLSLHLRPSLLLFLAAFLDGRLALVFIAVGSGFMTRPALVTLNLMGCAWSFWHQES